MLVDQYLGITGDEHVVVAYTPNCRDFAGYVLVTLRRRGVAARAVVMGAIHDDGVEARLAAALPDPAELGERRVVLVAAERSTISHTEVIPRLLRRYPPGRVRQVRAVNATAELLTHALNRTPAEITAANSAVLHRLMGVHRLEMTTAGGSRLTAELDSERERVWISNRGVAADGETALVPSGEVATLPLRMDGVFVADGAFSVNAAVDGDTRLGAAPVRLEIRDNVLADWSCPDAGVRELLGQLFDLPHAREVGELGFGTNSGIPGFIRMNSFVNERFPGIHIGSGSTTRASSSRRAPPRCTWTSSPAAGSSASTATRSRSTCRRSCRPPCRIRTGPGCSPRTPRPTAAGCGRGAGRWACTCWGARSRGDPPRPAAVRRRRRAGIDEV